MSELRLPVDYVDLLRAFVEHEVDFVVVGGWAVAVHGHARATDDLDLFVDATPENAPRVYRALEAFGAPLDAHSVTPGLFAHAEYGYRMGFKPLLIEVLTTIDGVSFEDAKRDAITAQVDDFEVSVIGRAALLANKRAAGRPKDLADIEALSDDED